MQVGAHQWAAQRPSSQAVVNSNRQLQDFNREDLKHLHLRTSSKPSTQLNNLEFRGLEVDRRSTDQSNCSWKKILTNYDGKMF